MHFVCFFQQTFGQHQVCRKCVQMYLCHVCWSIEQQHPNHDVGIKHLPEIQSTRNMSLTDICIKDPRKLGKGLNWSKTEFHKYFTFHSMVIIISIMIITLVWTRWNKLLTNKVYHSAPLAFNMEHASWITGATFIEIGV